jgi:pimeloyl-ACP methyl ester carboxylesterase
VTPESPGRPDDVTLLAAPSVTDVATRTADGVRLRGLLLNRPADPAETPAVVVGHGFTNHVRKPYVRRILDRLARTVTVVALDFRGHGRSGGRCTVGDTEVHDIAAGVRLAREHGHRRVATLGFSMGASVVLRHAALEPGTVDAVVSVSSPSRWWIRETVPMRRVHWLLEAPSGRATARALGLRLGPQWSTVPVSPIELVDRIAPAPLLIVHGTEDHYFPPEHATALYAAAGDPRELWLLPGVRHAETAMTPDLVDRIAGWLVNRTGPSGVLGQAAS